MDYDLERVRSNIRNARTDDLLDRVTVYRSGMEPDAVLLIEVELRRRGVSDDEIDRHQERRRLETRLLPDGTVVRCDFCHQPATAEGWGWHRLWGRYPIFPRFYHYCDDHRPDRAGDLTDHAEEPEEPDADVG